MRRRIEIAPAIRDRTIRRRLRFYWLVGRWAEYLIGWTIVLLIGASMLALAGIIGGCTALTYEQQRELSLQAKGCYCAAKECAEIKSAAGRAAIAAAGGQVVNITKVEKPER